MSDGYNLHMQPNIAISAVRLNGSNISICGRMAQVRPIGDNQRRQWALRSASDAAQPCPFRPLCIFAPIFHAEDLIDLRNSGRILARSLSREVSFSAAMGACSNPFPALTASDMAHIGMHTSHVIGGFVSNSMVKWRMQAGGTPPRTRLVCWRDCWRFADFSASFRAANQTTLQATLHCDPYVFPRSGVLSIFIILPTVTRPEARLKCAE